MNKLTIDLERELGTVDRKIFGHFTEHAFANVYGGIYDPENPLSDADGQRADVLEKLKAVGVPLLRYPGGNFVSNYHWEDGIGPKSERKRRFEYAWITEESNQFGTADFILECRKLGAEPYICVNMGSGTVEEAMHWVEYCNGTGNTYYANLRREHGYEEPFGVKYWGLGNEMYGSWQMEALSKEAYSAKALEFAKGMKWVDPTICLIACGVPEDSEWNTEAMRKLYGIADMISAHHYAVDWGPFEHNNYLQNLYVPRYMENVHQMVLASITVGANNSESGAKVAWDEWNLFGWLIDGVDDDRSYTLQNALVTGSVLNFFIRNCETVGLANYSTFVNINGALSVKKNGVVCRPQYHVFDLIGNNTGTTLVDSHVSCGSYSVVPPDKDYKRPVPRINSVLPKKKPEPAEDIPYLDAVVTKNEQGEVFVSLINKHLDEDLTVELRFYGDTVPTGEAELLTLWHEDVWAANTEEDPDNVRLQRGETIPAGEKMTVTLKKHSANVIKLKI